MSRSQSPARTPRLALWWLALVLVVAPLLGRMHQVVHAPGWSGAPAAWMAHPAHGHGDLHLAQAPAAAQGVDGAATSGSTDTPHALFASHAGADCQLLDQQLLGGALLAGLVVLEHASPPGPALAPATAPVDVRRLPAFLARAPPQQA